MLTCHRNYHGNMEPRMFRVGTLNDFRWRLTGEEEDITSGSYTLEHWRDRSMLIL